MQQPAQDNSFSAPTTALPAIPQLTQSQSDPFSGGSQPDTTQQILSARFQQQPQQQQSQLAPSPQPQSIQDLMNSITQLTQPTLNDVSRSIGASIAAKDPSIGPDTIVQKRLAGLKEAAGLQEALAKSQLYSQGGGAGGGGSTIKAAQMLMAENPNISFADAYSIAKSGLGQGITYNNGQVSPFAGAPQAAGAMAYGKAGGGNQSDLEFKPKISRATEAGKQLGEEDANLMAAEAALPQLEQAVTTLSQLGKKATYTMAGQLRDAAVRQMGFGATEGAKAREAYVAHVKNNVLPLLRRTFGAAFTRAEGDSLLATFGDPNKSPEEKDSVLQALIEDKIATIGTMQRQTGKIAAPPSGGFDELPNPADYSGSSITDTQTRQKLISNGNAWVPVGAQ